MRQLPQERSLASEDELEFEAFAARDSGRLLGLALLLTGNRQDAEDLVQHALLRAAGRWRAARQQPDAYTRTALVNLARDRWRVSRRRVPETLSDDLAQLAPAAGDAAATSLDRLMLLRACRLLPVQQRAVLALRFWEDRSVEETAALLGCTTGTVKSHTHRALAQLRRALHDQEEAGYLTRAEPKETSC
jgi:RNA polymerase sigma-70 factor (sigma-E family)